MAGSAEPLIRQRIERQGSLTFSEFMTLALYAPEVGYYAARANPLGRRGDYYTSAELHPGFAAMIGLQVEEVWQALGCPSRFVIHEGGPGSGIFARDLLNWFRAQHLELYSCLEYRMEEASPALRAVQRDRLSAAGHLRLAQWVDRPTEDGSANLVFANELLDALPVHLVQSLDGELREVFVTLVNRQLVLKEGDCSTPALVEYFQRLQIWPGEGCRAEVNLAAVEWVQAAGRTLGDGLMLIVDYGYPADVLYDARRRLGTLLCYYRHTVSSDPLVRIGAQDLTSHVDFTTSRWAGESVGLTTLGLVSQARLLNNLDWAGLRLATERRSVGQAERDANARALDQLVAGDGLGRLLALVQQRHLDGFAPRCLVGGPPSPWTSAPTRGPEHLRLPNPAEAEGLLDFESQWAELNADESDR